MNGGAEAFATAFAAQIARWAARRGCDAPMSGALHDAALAVCQALGDGHVCVELPGQQALREQLLRSGLVGTAQQPGGLPLILDDSNRLYLHRYFDCERRLANRLVRLRHASAATAGPAALQCLEALFTSPPRQGAGVDWQRQAALHALQNRLTIISGGPGTGKTTTVVKLLACLLADAPRARIVLCAPTGKARARLLETIEQRSEGLPPALRALLPREAFTIHRLLGMQPGRGAQYHAGNPLALDVLIVDEASMLDLALAARLIDALPAHARVVLLGDKDQLAAVESGAVFAEVCNVAAAEPLAGSLITLRDSHRFDARSGIARLAAEVSAGNAPAALAMLRDPRPADLQWIGEAGLLPDDELQRSLLGIFEAYFETLGRAPQDAAAVSSAFSAGRVLCAVREGRRGVAAINERIEAAMRPRLRQLAESLGLDGRSAWYPGRPVLITQNDYTLGLMNGDVGIALPDATGQLGVHFPAAQGGLRALSPARLPAHETTFATTVHKAQGSEFDTVLLVLPEAPSPVLTRELVYTAITRARRQVILCAAQEVLAAAIDAPTRRLSGLPARLSEAFAALPRDILVP